MIDGWKLVTVNMEKSKNLMDLFKDSQTNFGLDTLLIVPTASTIDIKAITITISGEDYWMRTSTILRVFLSISMR